jgi:hypothetical protein
MSKHFLPASLVFSITLIVVSLRAFAQTSGNPTPVVVPGLTTNKLGTPLNPTAAGSASCSGSNYTYAVTALDFAGGSTTQGGSSTAVPCTPGSGAQYIKVTTPVVNGAASCNVFRTAPTGQTGYIGNVLCGGMLLDTGQTASSVPGVPSSDQTGGVNAAGAVNAQVFTATGLGAGTDVLTFGSPLGICTNPPTSLCIPSSSAFFQQAPGGSGNSIGITWPPNLTATSTLQTNPLIGPFLFGSTTGSFNGASPVTIGSLTNFLNPILATAASTSLPTSHLLMANSTSDVADSGIGLSSGKIPWDAIGGPQTSNQSLVMAARTTTWTWSGAQTGFEFNFQGGNGSNSTDYVQWQAGNNTGTKNFFDITDTTTNGSATGSLLNVFTSTGSTMIPFTATVGGTANGIQVSGVGTLSKIGTGHVNADQCNSNNCPFYSGSAPTSNDLTKWGSSGALVDDTALTDDGTTLSYAGAVSTGGGKFTISSAGTITKMSNAAVVGVPGLIWDTASAASSGNLGPTQLWAGAGSGPHAGRFSWYVEQTAAGVACGGSSNTTVTLNVIYTPPSRATALTQSLGTLTIATGNGAAGNFVSNGTYPIGIKTSQPVSYSTTNYTQGSGCTTPPTYTVYPVFELFF